MIVVSLDIGIYHLGVVKAEITDCKINKIISCGLYDLTDFSEKRYVSEWVRGFIEVHKSIFEDMDTLLIEQQPPLGLISVQEVFHFAFHSKVVIISPVSMHKYMGISHLTYDDRKKVTTRLANRKLCSFNEFIIEERKHDMADAYCMIVFYLTILFEKQLQLKVKMKEQELRVHMNLEKFIYDGN